MLAWVHQALAGEREFVFALFGDDKAAAVEDVRHSSSGRDCGITQIVMVLPLCVIPDLRLLMSCLIVVNGMLSVLLRVILSIYLGGSLSDDSMSSTALLDRIFESICRPLKVRIEQV